MHDETAISQIKQRNPQGLKDLVTRYQQKAVYSAYLILRDRGLAEDVAQNAFLKAYDKIQQFSDGRPFYPWLVKIVINDALKLAKLREKMVSLEETDDQDARMLAQWLVDPSPTPERQIEIKEDEQTLRNALLRLNPRERAVVVMRYYLEMSEAEMAGQIGKPVSTVKWILRSAKKRMRTILRPATQPEDKRN
jgi:RNA polymerase sigma-70 factor (ECF subfamily)